jgi:hypothetical protein
MENWKRAVIAGSIGAGALFFLKGKRHAGFLFSGIGLAALASEYPEQFRDIRRNLHKYVDQGSVLLEVSSRVGERIADATDGHNSHWYHSLVSEGIIR